MEVMESRLSNILQNNFKEELQKEVVPSRMTSDELQEKFQNEVDGLQKKF